MRVRSLTFFGVLLVLGSFTRSLAAQQPASRRQVALDAGLLAGGLNYARMTGPARLLGVGIGVGYELNVRLVHGEPWGTKSAEIGHLDVFERLETAGRWQYDLGVRVAGDIHTAKVASEATPGGFLGGYIAPMWGVRHFRIGPRIQAGAYWSSSRPALGISVTPFMARLLFTF
jgi:hypothetical protein